MENATPSKTRVIAIDDEAASLDLLARALRQGEYALQTFTSPVLALKAIESGGCDVVVTDIRMSDIGGVALARRVREIDQAIAIVMVSGYTGGQEIAEARDSGVVDIVVSKPWNARDLREEVQKAARLVGRRRGTKSSIP